LVDQFDQFPTNLAFTIHGYVAVGQNVSPPPEMASLIIQCEFPRDLNPAVVGGLQEKRPPDANKKFQLFMDLQFDPEMAVDTPTMALHGIVTISGTHHRVEKKPFTVELATLEWLLASIKKWEFEFPTPSTLQFLARLRKVYLTAPSFNMALSHHAKEPKLFDDGDSRSLRLRAGRNIRFEADLIDIGHVLVGIEGSLRQHPKPHFMKVEVDPRTVRVDLIMTWAGDLGGALQRFISHKFFGAFLKNSKLDPDDVRCLSKNTDQETLQCYVEVTASTAELVGDVDGVNIGSVFEPARTLADNLRIYYQSHSEQRYTLFLQNTKTDTNEQALTLQAGGSSRKLSASSISFLAEQISRAAKLLVLVRLWENQANPPMPEEVTALLRPDSWAVQQLTTHFALFLETGLNRNK
jgi:hypothetical protein